MLAKSILCVVLALTAVAGSLAFPACGTPTTGETAVTSSASSTTTATSARHWQDGGVSLDWPAGWKRANDQTMRWPLARLIARTPLFALDRGDPYPRVELARLELRSGETLQTTFDNAYALLAAEWGTSMRKVTGWSATVDGLPALVKSYELPHGEPYYKQQDVWIESRGSLYVLAGRDGVGHFDENIPADLETMMRSLRFDAAATTTTGAASTTTVSGGSVAATLGPNDRRQEVFVAWSPAETIPAADVSTLTEALATHGQRMLFPSPFPLAGPAGQTSAEFLLYRTPPTGVVELYVRVEAEDHGFDITLASSADYSSVVDWGLETVPGAVDVTVRGSPGKSYPGTDDSRPMIYWQEEGQHFVAAYRGLSVELTAETLIHWLDSWHMLG